MLEFLEAVMMREVMSNRAGRRVAYLLLAIVAVTLGACRPTPQSNVLGYLLGKQFGTLANPDQAQPPGALEGRVLGPDARPVSNATVIVAERTGAPHTARTNAEGRYRIEGIPPDQYVPAAVAPGLAEGALQGVLGAPALVTIRAGATANAPDLMLAAYTPPVLPADLAAQVNLRQTAAYTANAPFPEGSVAQVKAFAFDYNGVTIDTLRLYLPLDVPPDADIPACPLCCADGGRRLAKSQRGLRCPGLRRRRAVAGSGTRG